MAPKAAQRLAPLRPLPRRTTTPTHSADAVPTEAKSSTTTSEARRASCFIVSPPEDPPLPAILAGRSRPPATSSLAERIASRAGASAATISGALCASGVKAPDGG